MYILLSTKTDRKIAIVSGSYSLVFTANTNATSTIELVPRAELKNQSYRKLTSNAVFGFIGMIEVDGLIFLGVISSKAKVAEPLPQESINCIVAVDFFCLNDSKWDFVSFDLEGNAIGFIYNDKTRNLKGISRHPCTEMMKLLSNGAFYFSNDFDLTSRLQHRGTHAHSLSEDQLDQEFMWNSYLTQEIIRFKDRQNSNIQRILDDEGFLTVVICGFVRSFQLNLGSVSLSTTMISRQSWKRAGTRTNARGVDDNGDTANFVETETIVLIDDVCFSFVQVRGSVPVFWDQEKPLLNKKLRFTRSIETTQPVFEKHFIKLCQKYGPVEVVNLLSSYKNEEKQLAQRYRDHLSNIEKLDLGKDIFIADFDFNEEVSKRGLLATNNIVPLITNFIEQAGYFSYDLGNDRILTSQNGVCRTNCLDCLERTNIIQQIIANLVVTIFLRASHVVKPTYTGGNDLFSQCLMELWTENGNRLSQLSAGTNELKSSLVRKGRNSWSGKISDATKSVNRFYNATFLDKIKEQNIDTLLGRLPYQKLVRLNDPVGTYINKCLKANSESFTKQVPITIHVGTFNINGMTTDTDLASWLASKTHETKADVLILGFQEVIELTAGSMMSVDTSRGTIWEETVSKCLKKICDEYVLVRWEQVTSLLLLFYAKSSHASNIKDVEIVSKKTGFRGMSGNKGAIGLRFCYGDNTFCFINSHLSAGQVNIDDRRENYENILNNMIFSRSRTISSHDYIVWFGDLNYRVTLENCNVRKLLADLGDAEAIQELLGYDQLLAEMESGLVFQDFNEAQINFLPTYKFDNGTNNYDTSDKQRTPSWTDRILYKGDKIHPLEYSDVELLLSDHKPVYAIFECQTFFVDSKKQQHLLHQLYLAYHRKHLPSSLPVDDAKPYKLHSVRPSATESDKLTTHAKKGFLHDFNQLDNRVVPNLLHPAGKSSNLLSLSRGTSPAGNMEVDVFEHEWKGAHVPRKSVDTSVFSDAVLSSDGETEAVLGQLSISAVTKKPIGL